MRGTFWQGMIWGWIAAGICSVMFGSFHHRRPLMERGPAAFRSVTRELLGEVDRFRRHLIRRFH